MKSYFIAATGTDAGKTHILTGLIQAAKSKNIKVDAIKPVASGLEEDSDTHKIIKALGNEKGIISVSPWVFADPVSPDIAARRKDYEINFDEVVKFCRERIDSSYADVFFLESAGGIMTPINSTHTFLDLAAALKLPIILITLNYLGTISHSLTALNAIKQKGLQIKLFIYNNYLENDLQAEEIITSLKNFSENEIIKIEKSDKNIIDIEQLIMRLL